MRKFCKLAAVSGAVLATATAASVVAQAVPANAAPAHAQAASSAAVRVVQVTVPMTVAGFDAAVARAHGYVIRTDAQGRQYSVKAGAAAIPGNRVYGNCGDSWLYEIAVGNHAVDIRTGFDVNTPAVAFYWKYWMHDLGGTSSHDDGGGLAFRNTWETDDRWGALTPGPANAWVDSGSDAILDDGSVCVTAGPADSTTIY